MKILNVKPILSNEDTQKLVGTYLDESVFKTILKEDADVYDENGLPLIRFRKGVISNDLAYDTLEALEPLFTSTAYYGNRKTSSAGFNGPVPSSVIGFMDRWSPKQKAMHNLTGIPLPGPSRVCAFNAKFPDRFKATLPFFRQIDKEYKALFPKEHALQIKAAKSTPFHIDSTSFSTITVNKNYRTAAHTDSGDWPEGFGNLIVIEDGSPYKGSYTGFPQYGIAVDCRQGDFLGMDVHRIHGNSPMIPKDESSTRVSFVCYLREGIVEKSQHQPMYDPVALKERIQRSPKRVRKYSKGKSPASGYN